MKLKGRRQSEKVQTTASEPIDAETQQLLDESSELVRHVNDRHGMTNPMGRKAGYVAMDPIINKSKAKNRTRDPYRSPEYWSEWREATAERDKDMMGPPTHVKHDNKGYTKK